MKQIFKQTTFLVLAWVFSFLGMTANAQMVQVGTGTLTSSTNPIYSCYGYNYTQQIYTAAEVLAANSSITPTGPITNLRFNINTGSYHSSTATFNTWTVYIGFVAQNSFTTNTNWVPLASMTQVFSGVLTFPPNGNWLDIPLSTLLTWNGTSNIVVAVLETVPSYSCTMLFTATSTGVDNRTIYFYSDGTVPNPTTPPSASGRSTTRPNVQFEFQRPPCDANTVYPASASTVATPSTTTCGNTSVSVTMTPSSNMPSASGLTYQLQYATSVAGPWTNFGTPQAAFTNMSFTPPFTSYVRVVTLCAGSPTSFISNPTLVTVGGPTPPIVANDTSCGPRVFNLTASSPNSITWYDAITGGNILGTGNTFTTPFLTNTTSYYVSAKSTGAQGQFQVGTGTTSRGGTGFSEGVYSKYYQSYHLQMLYTSAEIIAAGGGAGVMNSIAFNCTSLPNTPMPNYSIKIAFVSNATATAVWLPASSYTQVFTSASLMPTIGWNTYTFGTPLFWNGVDNIMISVCWDNTASWNSSGDNEATAINNMVLYYNSDFSNTCPETSGFTTNFRPNAKFGIVPECHSARQEVKAVVSDATPVTTSLSSNNVCHGDIVTIQVSSPLSNYTSYSWVSLNPGQLFTDAGATTPYTGAPTPIVYFKGNVGGVNRVVVNASNSTSGCAYSDTTSIFVQPNGLDLQIVAAEDTFCRSGQTQINVSNPVLYAAANKSWFVSNDGINYTPLTVTTLPFNTPALTSTIYYRMVTSTAAGACDTIDKAIVVNTPSIVSAADSGRCGPGSVTLVANGSPGTTIYWFNNSSGLMPIATGDTFVTPYLVNSTKYYLSASSSQPQPPATWVNQGPQTMGAYGVNPFYGLYYGTKTQVIVRASELLALGFGPGNITNIAWKIGQVWVPNLSGFTVRMKQTTATAVAGFDNVGLQTVYTTPVLTLTANTEVSLALNTPFAWDGVSNILIETCFNNTSWSSPNEVEGSTQSFNAGTQYDADNSTVCATTTSFFNSTNRPNMKFTMSGGCSSNIDSVTAFISERPVVDLGPDIERCVDAGELEFLNARNPGLNYTWDNGYNGQVRVADRSGTYWVYVDNGLGCGAGDTVNILFKPNPISTLGNDTTVCIGQSVTLDAGNDGIQYYWNNGGTTSAITVNQPGSYVVVITADNGCVKTDTIVVNHNGLSPSHDGIRVQNVNSTTFRFSLVNPRNIASIGWDFGDGSPISYALNPTHTYPTNGNYVVRVYANSNCGSTNDTSTVHIKGATSIDDISKEGALQLYPNPTANDVTVKTTDGAKLKAISVYTVDGKLLISESNLRQASTKITLDKLHSGVYYMVIETENGIFKRKLDVLK